MENKRLKAAVSVLSIAVFTTSGYTAFEKIKHLEIEVKLLNQIVQQKDDLIKVVRGQMKAKEEELSNTKSELEDTKNELANAIGQIDIAKEELGIIKKELESIKKVQDGIRIQLDSVSQKPEILMPQPLENNPNP